MFAPGQVPGDSPDGFTASSGGVVSQKRRMSRRSLVGAVPSAGKRSGRKPLGTLAKTAVVSKFGRKSKRTLKPLGIENSGSSRKYPSRRVKRTVEDERASRLRKFALQNCAVSVLRDCRKPGGKPM